MAPPTRVLLIGLDSAERDLLDAWGADGTLPVLQRLREAGLSAPVTTPPGLGNGALWPSVFTGANPGRHGRYFRYPLQPGSYEPGRFDADHGFAVAPFWQVLSDAGRRVAVFDMVVAPLTPGLHGIQVADWTTHDGVGPPRSAPPGLVDDVVRRFGADPLGGNGDVPRDAAGYRLLRDQMVARVHTKTACALHYLEQRGWDFFTVVYGEPHDVGHHCWHLHDASSPRHDPALARKLGDPIRDVYAAIDRGLAALVEAAGPDATVLVFSGPGMGPPYSGNHLLEEVLRRLDAPRRTPRMRAVAGLRTLYRAVVPARMRERAGAAVSAVAQRAHRADMSGRRFFSVPHNQNSGAIRLNVAGREPHGTVRPGPELDAVVAELTAELTALVNLDTGRPAITEIVRVDRAFHGSRLDTMPDLLAVWSRDHEIERLGSRRIGEVSGRRATTIRTGDHTPHALLVARGPGLGTGTLPEPVAAEDLAPTVAAILGVTLPDTDGTPIAALAGPTRRRTGTPS